MTKNEVLKNHEILLQKMKIWIGGMSMTEQNGNSECFQLHTNQNCVSHRSTNVPPLLSSGNKLRSNGRLGR